MNEETKLCPECKEVQIPLWRAYCISCERKKPPYQVPAHMQLCPECKEVPILLWQACCIPCEYKKHAYQYEPPYLPELCKALGWQGGTIHQVIDEVKRLKVKEPRTIAECPFRICAFSQNPRLWECTGKACALYCNRTKSCSLKKDVPNE